MLIDAYASIAVGCITADPFLIAISPEGRHESYEQNFNPTLRLTARVRNIFDEDPPFPNQNEANFHRRGADPLGHTYLLRASYYS